MPLDVVRQVCTEAGHGGFVACLGVSAAEATVIWRPAAMSVSARSVGAGLSSSASKWSAYSRAVRWIFQTDALPSRDGTGQPTLARSPPPRTDQPTPRLSQSSGPLADRQAAHRASVRSRSRMA